MSSNLALPTLSFCIPTYNRATFLAEVLENIAAQASEDCEIVVSDNGSTDETRSVVTEFARGFDRLRYVRHDENRGPDRNIDSAVELASGKFCWLFSDDDLLKPGAVAYVLSLLRRDPSLIILNFEVVNLVPPGVITARWSHWSRDRVYGGHELDRLLVELSYAATFLSAIVIRRDIWISRDRALYYDSHFIQTGVIFQEPFPSDVIAVATPFVTCRKGNTTNVDSRPIEGVLVLLPNLLRKTGVSRTGIANSDLATPWRHPSRLLFARAVGIFSMKDHRSYIVPRANSRWERAMSACIAILPRVLVSYLLISVYWAFRVPAQWPYSVKLALRAHAARPRAASQ